MKLLLAFWIISFPSLLSMDRIPSTEIKQRAHQTVSGKNRLARSTSAKFERAGQAIKRSTSSNALYNLAKAATKPYEKGSKEVPKLSSSHKAKKLQFEPFIDKELLKLTAHFDQDAKNRTARWRCEKIPRSL
ncbi:hypothetical protein BH09DEP1_BH09DEP1_8240 [soil metagenome]